MDHRAGLAYWIYTHAFPICLLASSLLGLKAASLSLAQEAPAPSGAQPAAKEWKLQVRAKGSGRAIKRVEFRLFSAQPSAEPERPLYSNPKGEVDLSTWLPVNDSRKTLKVSIFRSGYAPVEISLADLWALEDQELYLDPGEPNDNAITIVGKKRNEVSRQQVTIEEAKAVAPRGDPVQITKLLPGVQSSPFGSDVIVRGSDPNDSGYYVDGFKVPFIYHSVGQVSVLPEKIYDNISFAAGGFGVQYGEATGGVIDLSTKSNIPKEDVLQAKVNIPLYSGVYYETALSKDETFSVGWRKSYLGFFLRRILTEDDLSVIPEFYDTHIRYVHKHKGGFTKLLVFNSADVLEAAFPSEAADADGSFNFEVSTYFGSVGVQDSRKLSKDWRLITTPQAVFSRNKFDVADSFFRLKNTLYRLPIEAEYRIHRKDKLYLGFEFEHDTATVDLRVPDVNPDEPFQDFEDAPRAERSTRVDYNHLAMWSAVDVRIGKDLVITPGLRLLYTDQMQEAWYDPRVSLFYKWSKDDQFKFATGQYSKRPLAQETDEVFGNADLGYEKVMHYIFGWESNWSERWSSDVQLYSKFGWDFVRGSDDALINYTDSGEFRSQGFELLIRRNRTERFFGWLALSYSKSEDRKNTDSPWKPSEFDQTYNINLVLNYGLSGTFSLGGRVNYRSGDRYTPVADVVYNASTGRYLPRSNREDVNAERLPDYYQIDVYSVYDILFRKWLLKLRTGVEYIALTRPAFGIDYNYDYSEERFVEGVPPIPYIEVSGEF